MATSPIQSLSPYRFRTLACSQTIKEVLETHFRHVLETYVLATMVDEVDERGIREQRGVPMRTPRQHQLLYTHDATRHDKRLPKQTRRRIICQNMTLDRKHDMRHDRETTK